HSDALLASAGSGLATLGIPSSPGVPQAVTQNTIVCPYNDLEQAAGAVARYGEGLAAIVVEPVAGNMGVGPPEPGFLELLRPLCRRRRASRSSAACVTPRSTRTSSAGRRGSPKGWRPSASSSGSARC